MQGRCAIRAPFGLDLQDGEKPCLAVRSGRAAAVAGVVAGQRAAGITRARKAFSLWTEVPGLLVSAMGSPTQRSSGLLGFMERA